MEKQRGYFGIGILNPKREDNIGTLWRSASVLGASFIFTIGKRYKKQASDTAKSWKHIPLFNYSNFDEFKKSIPYSCKLIGIELNENSIPLNEFSHPERCIYLLGAEDFGLTNEAIDHCENIVQIQGDHCLNVSVAGSIIMYDRLVK